MKAWTLALGLLLTGCPAAHEEHGDIGLAMSGCTRTSRIAAAWNCEPLEMECKISVLEPAGCAEEYSVSKAAAAVARMEAWLEKREGSQP